MFIIKMKCGKYLPADYTSAAKKEYTPDTEKALQFNSPEGARGMWYTPGHDFMNSEIVEIKEKQT